MRGPPRKGGMTSSSTEAKGLGLGVDPELVKRELCMSEVVGVVACYFESENRREFGREKMRCCAALARIE